jgi:hypothetical protein
VVVTSCTAEDLPYLLNFAPVDSNRSSRSHSKKVGRRRVRRCGCLSYSGPCVINVYTCYRTLINRGGPRLSRLCHGCLCAISMQTSRWNISSRVSPLLCLRPCPNRSLLERTTRILCRHFGNDVRFAGKCTLCVISAGLYTIESIAVPYQTTLQTVGSFNLNWNESVNDVRDDLIVSLLEYYNASYPEWHLRRDRLSLDLFRKH